MADNSATSTPVLNILLTAWGLVVPLIVGTVSAWWNKKNNLEERSYQRKLLVEDQQKACEIENIKNQLLMRKEHFLNTKVAILNYLRISHENFHSNIQFLSCPIDNLDEKNELLNEYAQKSQEMSNSYNELYLLVPTIDVAKSSTMLLNHLSRNKITFLNKESIVEMATTYAKLREELLIAARKYTQVEEQNIINIAQSQ
jgi:hypothetical protein